MLDVTVNKIFIIKGLTRSNIYFIIPSSIHFIQKEYKSTFIIKCTMSLRMHDISHVTLPFKGINAD